MKKFVKVVLYITAGCIGIGIAALILGIVLGKDSMDFQTDGTASLAENVVHYLTGTAHTRIPDKDQREKESAGKGTADLDDTKLLAVPAEEIQELKVDLHHGSLQVNESSDENIYVFLERKEDIAGRKQDVNVTQEQGRLVVSDERTGNHIRKEITLYLNIPKHHSFLDVQIGIDAGVIQIDTDLTSDRMVLDADAGEITAEKLYADDFQSSVGAGCIDVVEGKFGRMDLNCGLGTINMKASVSSDSKMNCGMGTIDFELQEEELDAYNYAVSCGMGTIEIGDDSYSSLSREKRINNQAKATFTLKCGMGEIQISS